MLNGAVSQFDSFSNHLLRHYIYVPIKVNLLLIPSLGSILVYICNNSLKINYVLVLHEISQTEGHCYDVIIAEEISAIAGNPGLSVVSLRRRRRAKLLDELGAACFSCIGAISRRCWSSTDARDRAEDYSSICLSKELMIVSFIMTVKSQIHSVTVL